jgi:hypothetical protein
MFLLQQLRSFNYWNLIHINFKYAGGPFLSNKSVEAFVHKITSSFASFYMRDVADCSEMEQGELEVYWGQPFLVKSNLGYWDWPAGQKARLPHTQVQLSVILAIYDQ